MVSGYFQKGGRIRQERGGVAQYMEHLGHYFDTNSITEGSKKRMVFLSVVGLSVYRLLKNLISPAKPGEKSYSDLVKTNNPLQPYRSYRS